MNPSPSALGLVSFGNILPLAAHLSPLLPHGPPWASAPVAPSQALPHVVPSEGRLFRPGLRWGTESQVPHSHLSELYCKLPLVMFN